jgi:tetratricopeptide (TPR) repeat protein
VLDYRLAGDARCSNYAFNQALIAYDRTLTYVSRQQTPQLRAAILVDIGRANWELGIRAEGFAIGQYLSAAMKAYHQALEVYTRAQLPQDWALTPKDLAKSYKHLENWSDAAESFANVLTVHPDDKEAYDAAGYLYHERLFNFPQAFALNQRWLERHPEDLAALSRFAETHFTTGGFTECEQHVALLLANSAVEPAFRIAL